MFDRVLVANRGEIARRIIRSCRRLGVGTVAVYSDADAGEPHVVEADLAVRLGPPEAARSYLAADRLLEVAQQVGADAVHPGYGFLSENAEFAEAVSASGFAWIGPSPHAITTMGDKAEAKRLMHEVGVPVVPGFDAATLTESELVDACRDLGAPLLIKATAGGGGKGMRPVRADREIIEAVRAARREAVSAFGDERLIVERLIDRPRHIEVQVFADSHGHAIHLHERDCSVQRRHQKIVEEAPAVALDPELREQMAVSAVRAAQAVQYTGAGTVEFIVGASSQESSAATYHFLEMNTRLQVEHPVTELITGLDLVEWQLRVAAGESLPATQDQIDRHGHAIEVRIYAEDPGAGFLPQTGTIARLEPPGCDARFDSAVEAGSQVSRHYDPMIAKLVVHGRDRATALRRLREELRRVIVHGVQTNLAHLQAIADVPVFGEGAVDTAFLATWLPDWRPAPLQPAQVAVVASQLLDEHQAIGGGHRQRAWRSLAWRAGASGGTPVRLECDGTVHRAVVRDGTLGRQVDVDGSTFDLVLGREGTSVVDGHVVESTITVVGEDVWAHVDGCTHRLRHLAPTTHADAAAVVGAGALASPMPGAILAVHVSEGETVRAGDVLLLVEAMKMEHPVTAPADGSISQVYVRAGDTVEAGAPLVVFEPAS